MDPQGTTVLDWLTAIGTVGAVVVALYIGVIRERRRQPSLSLTFEQLDPPDALEVPENRGTEKTTLIVYIHLLVSNRKGRHAAQDVEVIVTNVREMSARDGQSAVRGRITLGDQSLRWSNSSQEAKRTYTSIPAGVTRRVDFVRVENGLDEQGRLPLVLDVWPQPVNQRTHLRSASLAIELAVTASNADARRYTVVVHFDGHFDAGYAQHAGRIWDHLRVVPPSAA